MARLVHRNPVDTINQRYFREIAKCKRDFPHMHYTRNFWIHIARKQRVMALRALGYRATF